jgi:hypothetical protein
MVGRGGRARRLESVHHLVRVDGAEHKDHEAEVHLRTEIYRQAAAAHGDAAPRVPQFSHSLLNPGACQLSSPAGHRVMHALSGLSNVNNSDNFGHRAKN